jgi:hypothetical protein
MPIRLNLLAEAQAAEDLRRKDPVKRVMWAAAFLICVMLAWSSSLQLKSMVLNRDIARAENSMQSFTNEYQQVLSNKNKIQDINMKLAKLEELTTNRFLQANALNALQRTFVDDVQLLHVRTEQSYALTDEVKARTNDTRVIPGRPATATEKIVLLLDGADSSQNPGDQVLKYKDAISTNDWVRQMTGRASSVALRTISPPDMSMNGKRSVSFSLECRLPEVTR